MEYRHQNALRRIYEADQAQRDMGKEPVPFRHEFQLGLGPRLEHPCWDPSWATPAEETIHDLVELGLLRLDGPQGVGTSFSLSMKGRDEATRLVESAQAPVETLEDPSVPAVSRDTRKVAVMHGRDRDARNWMFAWLRSIDLAPLEWSDLVKLTGSAAPYNGDAVRAAFETAQAVVVLVTPDELGSLHPDLADDDGYGGREIECQARLNVILEAGMALQSHRDATVFVEIGKTREISDLAGLNTVRLKGDAAGLIALAERLETAGCPVQRSGEDWVDTHVLARLGALSRRISAVGSVGGVAATGVEGGHYQAFRINGRRVEGRAHEGLEWSGWSEVGMLEEDAIGLAAASSGPGLVEVFALLADGEVVSNRREKDEGWYPRFRSLGRPFGPDPVVRLTAGSKGHIHQEVFVEAADGSIAHIWWGGRWYFDDDPETRLNDGWWRF